MKRKIIALGLALSLLLSGCSSLLLDGEYVYTQPHINGDVLGDATGIHAGNYNELYNALCAMVEAGQEKGVIFVSSYDRKDVTSDAQKAVQKLLPVVVIVIFALCQTLTPCPITWKI